MGFLPFKNQRIGVSSKKSVEINHNSPFANTLAQFIGHPLEIIILTPIA
jgi:hypothetical protein